MTSGRDPIVEGVLLELVSGVTEECREHLASVARVESLPAGAILLREGRPTMHLGIVIEGRLSLLSPVPGHPDARLMTLDAGDIFGWSVVLDGTSTATVAALEPARVLLFERTALLAAIVDDTALAAALYRRLLAAVASRLEATRLQLLDLYRPAGAVG
jgi:CRP/FNR family transcriptional regulator, cyclic AMP receptor protein